MRLSSRLLWAGNEPLVRIGRGIRLPGVVWLDVGRNVRQRASVEGLSGPAVPCVCRSSFDYEFAMEGENGRAG